MVQKYRVCDKPYLFLNLPKDWKCPTCGHGKDDHIQRNGWLMCKNNDCKLEVVA